MIFLTFLLSILEQRSLTFYSKIDKITALIKKCRNFVRDLMKRSSQVFQFPLMSHPASSPNPHLPPTINRGFSLSTLYKTEHLSYSRICYEKGSADANQNLVVCLFLPPPFKSLSPARPWFIPCLSGTCTAGYLLRDLCCGSGLHPGWGLLHHPSCKPGRLPD
jgi:hypothetical protein